MITRDTLGLIVSEKSNLNREDARELVNELFNYIALSLEAGEEVNIHGFGRFIIKHMPERVNRDLYRDIPIITPAYNKVVYKPVPRLRRLYTI